MKFNRMIKLLISISILLKFTSEAIKNDINVVKWTIGGLRPYNDSLDFGLEFYSPTKPGSYPVIVFFTGLDGLVLGSFYDGFNLNLVNGSQSILLIFSGLSILHEPNEEEKIFEKTLNWTLENLNGLFNSEKTPVIIKNLVFPDIKTYGISLMGHSSGNHPIVSYLNKTCGNAKSIILDLLSLIFIYIF